MAAAASCEYSEHVVCVQLTGRGCELHHNCLALQPVPPSPPHQVSWIRHRDIHLLTVGRYTYTSDQRFRALHEDDSDDWILKINYVQHSLHAITFLNYLFVFHEHAQSATPAVTDSQLNEDQTSEASVLSGYTYLAQ
ncbi:hypothetical protein E2C01_081984 [Portunus trituberculatus]|uniref:Uncharacterized protein n=1 Tax=Portunus trituberculatus TaxID=210409 RepID=A0A5B7IY15_PORTR|nr:hypothetical protein [Portunus trituberculatus]